jgi:hypothetical protein
MGTILDDWNLETKMLLLEKAHETLPNGGALMRAAGFSEARVEQLTGVESMVVGIK